MIPPPAPQARPGVHRAFWLPWLILAIGGAAFAYRALRLAWQPLWWDEGYSVYFATEPLGQMLWLTAHDIHPPFYYALLHGWSALFGSGPVAARCLSAAIGAAAVPVIAWLAADFFPQRRHAPWIAALLLALHPLHLYYSQEVRMYGLGLLLGMVSTGCLWRAVRRLETGVRPWGWLAGYLLASALALHTLYYLGLLLGAQGVWALWRARRQRSTQRTLWAAWAAVLLLTLPWLLYALPKLVGYVAQKVESDQDRPLGPIDYLARHGAALLAGHTPAEHPWAEWLLAAALASGLLVLVLALWQPRSAQEPQNGSAAPSLLALLLVLPIVAGFLLNLRLPFFPAQGERLLLFVLPYLLLVLAWAVDAGGRWSALAALPLLAAWGVSGWLYYTTPRHTDHDYRPLIAQSIQQGRPGDRWLASFPWMLGYWRAYAPPALEGPTPTLLDASAAVIYGPPVEQAIDAALDAGTLWLPLPLSFGADLPLEMETYLRGRAANLENRWFGPATRLTAWTDAKPTQAHPLAARFGAEPGTVALEQAIVGTAAVPADNSPFPVTLVWQATGSLTDRTVTLRLVDAEGRTWAARDYAPPGSLGAPAEAAPTDRAGLLVPAGTPPGRYTLAVGVGSGDGETLLPVQGAPFDGMRLLPVAELDVILPAAPVDPVHLPMTPLARPVVQDGLALLGASLPAAPLLAGTPLALTPFARSAVEAPPDRTLAISLIDRQGARAAGWEGWPLAAHPTAAWPPGYAVGLPVAFDLPAALESGRYRVAAQWVDPQTATAGPPVTLGVVDIVQRAHRWEPPAGDPLGLPAYLNPPPQIGTHARLYAYRIVRHPQELFVDLWFEVLDTLLPPHHLFVHALDASGATVAQCDRTPAGAVDGPAPTGSWLPGEYVHADCTLALPPGAGPLELRLGLYEPQRQVRLPVFIDGQPAGDSVPLPLLAD